MYEIAKCTGQDNVLHIITYYFFHWLFLGVCFYFTSNIDQLPARAWFVSTQIDSSEVKDETTGKVSIIIAFKVFVKIQLETQL